MGPEAKVEADIVAWSEMNGGLALKLKIDGQRGFPDRTILMPGGIVLFVEVKKPKGGVVSQQQKDWVRKLQGRGFFVIVATSLEQVVAAHDLIRMTIRKTGL